MTMSRVLVTGAAGLLGRATVDALADEGIEVHALVRSKEQAFRADVEFHEVDLGAPLDARVLPERIDSVFHLSQAREFRDFPDAARRVFSINVASTADLLDYARTAAAESFVYASSGGVYRSGGVPLVEDAPLLSPADLGYYLGTKLSSEALVGSYGDLFSAVSLRYFFIYGPGQARGMLIPRLYDRVLNGQPIGLQGDNGMRINPVHVDDAAAATIAASRLKGRVTVNVAGPEVLSLRAIGELFGRDLEREPVFESSDGAAADLIASTDRMSESLVAPVIKVSDALSDIRE